MNRLGIKGLCLWLLLSSGAKGWWPGGHGIISQGAVQSLPVEMPAFFRGNAAGIAHFSADPDMLKNRSVPQLSDTEASEHYLDWELLDGGVLPKSRYEYLKFCLTMKLDPQKIGLLPYAVEEWTQRLTMAFAEYRRWPENPYVQQKCLLYAGMLSHYAADLCMPLHTTVHHDGRVKPNTDSPKTGIHHKVDALIERLSISPPSLAQNQKIIPLKDLWAGVKDELAQSHKLVDGVYRLEGKLVEMDESAKIDSAVQAFAVERGRTAVRFVAQLYLTAWENSANVILPDWLVRLRSQPSSAPSTQPAQ